MVTEFYNPSTARRRPGAIAKAIAAPIAFIDLEASGLNMRSWPVEVGWAFAQGEPSAMLVRPHELWRMEGWDPEAEALHGLTLEKISREGAPASMVASALNKALAGCTVYSDAPEWDAFWLYRLFGAARVRPAFSLLGFGELVPPLAPGRAEELLKRAAQLAPRTHRAAADARHLQTLYRLACGE